MSVQHDETTRNALDRVLQQHGLSRDTRLYREAMRDSLVATNQPGVFRLAANESPSESVVDIYGQGYLVQASEVGAGLAFSVSDAPNWQETMEMRALRSAAARDTADLDKVEVEVVLGSILQQGGLIYPVESVTVEQAWYCTIPSGSVEVREA